MRSARSDAGSRLTRSHGLKHTRARDGGGIEHAEHTGGRHEGHSVADFRRRFWVSLALTVPVILISPGLPFVPGGRILNVPGADWILLALSTVSSTSTAACRSSRASSASCATASPA